MKKYQKVRRVLAKTNLIITLPLQLSLFLFPIILISSPWIPFPIIRIYSIVILIFWGCVSISALIFRRAHCGYTCGITSLIILTDQIKRRKSGKNDQSGKSSLSYSMSPLSNIIIKTTYFLLPGILAAYYITGLIDWSLESSVPFIIVNCLFPLGALLSFSIGKSKSQHYLCPLAPFLISGTKIGKIFSQLDISPKKTGCLNCDKCSTICLFQNNIPELLTTGSFVERECINCGECSAVCPSGIPEYKFYTKTG